MTSAAPRGAGRVRAGWQTYSLLGGTSCGEYTGTGDIFDRNVTAFPPTGPGISAADSRVPPPPLTLASPPWACSVGGDSDAR